MLNRLAIFSVAACLLTGDAAAGMKYHVTVTSHSHDTADIIAQTSPDNFVYLITNAGNYSVQIEATPGAGQFAYPVIKPGDSVTVRGIDIRAYLLPDASEDSSTELYAYIVSKG